MKQRKNYIYKEVIKNNAKNATEKKLNLKSNQWLGENKRRHVPQTAARTKSKIGQGFRLNKNFSWKIMALWKSEINFSSTFWEGLMKNETEM